MVEGKTKVTLIGSSLATIGLEFIYEGEPPECSSCAVRKACHNLKAGRKYRIVGVRKARHNCPVHLGGTTTVEVSEASFPALLSPDMAIKNTRITFERSCNREECEHFGLCNPEGAVPGEKYVVVQVCGSGPSNCGKGRRLQQVELKGL